MPKGTNNTYPTEDVTLDNGARVLWSRLQRHRQGQPRGVPTICPCGHEHLAVPAHAIRSTFTGLCQACNYKRLALIGDLPYGRRGSVMHLDRHDPNDPRKRIITCGGPCDGNEYSAFPPPRKVREDPAQMAKIVGLCPVCKPRRYTGEMFLFIEENGRVTKVLFDVRRKKVSASGKSYDEVGIECRRCPVGQVRLINFSRVRGHINGNNRRKWSELCSEHANAPGAKLKLRGKRRKSRTSDTITVFHSNKKATTFFSLCKCPRPTGWEDAVTNWHKRPDSCPEHNTPAIRAELLSNRKLEKITQQVAAGNGNGQKNGDSHRPRADRSKWTLSAIDGLKVLFDSAQRYYPTRDERIASIKQADLATQIGITESRLRRRLRDKDCHLTELFPNLQQLYDNFREFVIAGFERGDSSEKILSDLLSSSRRIAA